MLLVFSYLNLREAFAGVAKKQKKEKQNGRCIHNCKDNFNWLSRLLGRRRNDSIEENIMTISITQITRMYIVPVKSRKEWVQARLKHLTYLRDGLGLMCQDEIETLTKELERSY